MKKITVSANDSGQRVDKLLQKSFESLPKSMMFKQIRKKNIKVNGKRCTPEQLVSEGDIIELYLADDLLVPKKTHYDFLKAPKLDGIIYEDENLIILDKPQGMLCHPDGKEYVNTLVSALKRYLFERISEIPFLMRFKIHTIKAYCRIFRCSPLHMAIIQKSRSGTAGMTTVIAWNF